MPTRAIGLSPARKQFVGGECLLSEIAMLGWDRFSKAQASLAAHAHPGTYEICYIVHGSVDWWAGDEVHEVGPGDVYITRPDEWHGGLDAMMHPNELYWVQVHVPPGGLCAWEAQAMARDFDQMKLRRFPGRPSIKDAFARLLAVHQARGSYATTLARAALHELLAIVVQCHEEYARLLRDQSHAQSAAIRRALRWMGKHLAEDYSIQKAADAAGLSISHFHERFFAEIGFTPADHRARARVAEAKQLLRAGDFSITEIAMAVGFSSSQYFATVFKNLTGMTPREYRRHLQMPKT
jgi:AraC family L-rhamnose operon regulatory protein RhaS